MDEYTLDQMNELSLHLDYDIVITIRKAISSINLAISMRSGGAPEEHIEMELLKARDSLAELIGIGIEDGLF